MSTSQRPGELLANIADVKIVDLAPGPNGQGFSRSQKGEPDATKRAQTLRQRRVFSSLHPLLAASTSVYAGHVIFEWLLTIYLLLLGTEVTIRNCTLLPLREGPAPEPRSPCNCLYQVQEGDLLWELIWPKGPDGQPCQRHVTTAFVLSFPRVARLASALLTPALIS